MSLARISQMIQFVWMFESHHQQRLSWQDAAKARVSRDRAEVLAAAQFAAMLDANPSGSLGSSHLNDPHNLEESGLL